MNEIETAVRRFIVHELLFQKDESVIKADDSLLERRIIDSAGMMDLVGFLEKEYAITVGRTEIVPENFDSISSISRLVEAKRAGR